MIGGTKMGICKHVHIGCVSSVPDESSRVRLFRRLLSVDPHLLSQVPRVVKCPSDDRLS